MTWWCKDYRIIWFPWWELKCKLTFEGGTLLSRGSWFAGQLGRSSNIASSRFGQVHISDPVVAMAAGGSHVVVISASQVRWFSSHYHHQIGSISLSIFVYFPWLCVWCCTIIFCQLLHYRSRESWVFVSITAVQYMTCANIWVHYGLKVVCLNITPYRSHYYLYADLSGNHKLVKRLSGIFCRVCVQDQLQLFFIQYMKLCVFSLPISPPMICTSYYN